MVEPCDAVKILVGRMQTNPEEFDAPTYDPNGSMTAGYRRDEPKFYRIGSTLLKLSTSYSREEIEDRIDTPWWFLTKAEIALLVAAYTELCRQKFAADIMAKLLATEEPVDSVADFDAKVAALKGYGASSQIFAAATNNPFQIANTSSTGLSVTGSLTIGNATLTPKDVRKLKNLISPTKPTP